MSKLINLKDEMDSAFENIEAYLHIKEAALKVFNKYPNINGDSIINKLCEQEGMSRETFNFICDIEKQEFNDQLLSHKRPKK